MHPVLSSMSVAVDSWDNTTGVALDSEGRVIWSAKNTRILNWNNGTLLYSPIICDYDFPSTKLDRQVTNWQVMMASFLTSHYRCFLCGEMGVSKTAAALWAVDYLLSKSVVKRVLVVGRVSLLRDAWMNDATWVLPTRRILLIEGSKAVKIAKLATATKYDICLTNYEALDGIEHNFHGLFDLVIADESTRIKNVDSKLHASFVKTIGTIGSRWFLTGAPSPTEYIDVYGQCVALGVPINYTHLPSSYWVARDALMVEVSKHRWVDRHEAVKIISRWMYPFLSVMKSDVMGGVMDPPKHIYIHCEFSVEQTEVLAEKHRSMEKAWEAVQFDRNPPIRLKPTQGNLWNQYGQAIACGIVFENGVVVREVDTTPRDEALLEVLKSKKGNAFVFIPYRQPCDRIKTLLEKHGYRAAVVQGGMTSVNRQKIFTAFAAKEIDVIIAVPSAIAHGVNGTSADLIIWYAPAREPESYMQANERIYRYGQTNAMRIVHLSSGANENRIYANQNKQISKQKDLLGKRKVTL